MKFYNLKYFFLFLILLIISQSVFCQEADTDDKPEDKTTSSTSDNDITTSSSQSVTTTVDEQVENNNIGINNETTKISNNTNNLNENEEQNKIDTDDNNNSNSNNNNAVNFNNDDKMGNNDTGNISDTRTTESVTTSSSSKSRTPSPTPSSSNHNGSSNSGSTSSNANTTNSPAPTQAPQQPQQTQTPQTQAPQPQDQNPVNADLSLNTPDNTTIGTMPSSNVGSKEKNNDGIPGWCYILAILLVAALLIGTFGFVMALQKKKKNELTPNLWAADDFDSRINPIATPANTYNMNNVPMSQPMSQPMYQQAAYGQAPVITDAYNQMPNQTYANEPLPPSTGVPIDNSYSDYPNGNPNEYIPTSIDELKVNNVYPSQFTFQPELDDEIEINIDDQIFIEEIFADNWALGVNTTTNARGCFPLNIFLNPKSTLDNSRSQRTLSYCSNGNGPAY